MRTMRWTTLLSWTRAYYRDRQAFDLGPPSFAERPPSRLRQIGREDRIETPAFSWQSLPSNWARRYSANGKIEFICLNCLEPICAVRSAHEASAFLDSHVCRHEESKRLAASA